MRKTRSLEQWRGIIEEQQSSDLTITEYCQQNALSKTTFYAAKNKLKALPDNFVRAKITKQPDVIKPQQPITLIVGKVKVSLPPTTPATYLSQLLREFA
ncbi:IS66 family insertion sequence element accessory protein TnpA [Colwellia ponticola]|uniref:IS66 family insertion sequence element accessory protein TnpB n=1 Tax=Colwellia ponticola TaxID=2304625 RepID=A0A8H2JP00_9GAMM|nr:IS66 family insertion sequence element accessory protein TnpB [Colwellia ponticola]TMM45792.1 IS66 family insertion sequence element accessory protein TnpB [Colwellia ponticola]